MSELKVHRFITTDELFPEANAGSLYYDKSEADKAIADLEQKLAAAQQVLRLNEPKALYSNLETMGRLKHEIDVVARRERHQKYKRCLAMARWCEDETEINHNSAYEASEYLLSREDYFRRREEHYERWRKRWLKLAEQFKPNNSTAK